MTAPLASPARIAVETCLGVRPGEEVFVIYDASTERIARALSEAAMEAGAQVVLGGIPEAASHGEEPPPAAARAMAAAGVVFAPTSKSLSHTEARRNACAAGTRVATLPGISEEIFLRCMEADYERIARLSRRLAGILTAGRRARLTSPAGTDLTLPIQGIAALADTGLLHEPGAFGNLPAGEAYLMPREGAATGLLVVDGSMAGIGALEMPLEIRVEEGGLVEARGGEAAERFLALIEPFGEPARNVAELGVGTNDRARITGNVLEDEKVLGTLHVAFGDNRSMGGTVGVASHLDGVVRRPTLAVDGQPILEDGLLLLD